MSDRQLSDFLFHQILFFSPSDPNILLKTGTAVGFPLRVGETEKRACVWEKYCALVFLTNESIGGYLLKGIFTRRKPLLFFIYFISTTLLFTDHKKLSFVKKYRIQTETKKYLKSNPLQSGLILFPFLYFLN